MEQPRFIIRCTYVKQGRLAMLSHLEVASALGRAVRRANLPFAVSEGFSPHMKLHFGAALPVGVGSTCEIFDLTLREYVRPSIVLERLQAASVPDLMVQGCSYVEPRAKAASVAFPVSTYVAKLSGDAAVLTFPETVTVIRKKKAKVLTVSEFLVGKPCSEGCALTFSLEAKPTGSLRPDKLLQAALGDYALEHPDDQLQLVACTRIAQREA